MIGHKRQPQMRDRGGKRRLTYDESPEVPDLCQRSGADLLERRVGMRGPSRWLPGLLARPDRGYTPLVEGYAPVDTISFGPDREPRRVRRGWRPRPGRPGGGPGW